MTTVSKATSRTAWIIALSSTFGAVTCLWATSLAKDVTLAPLVLLHAPATNLMLFLRSQSPVLAASFGALTYGGYAGSLLAGSQSRTSVSLVVFLLILIHVGCVMLLNVTVPLFGS